MDKIISKKNCTSRESYYFYVGTLWKLRLSSWFTKCRIQERWIILIPVITFHCFLSCSSWYQFKQSIVSQINSHKFVFSWTLRFQGEGIVVRISVLKLFLVSATQPKRQKNQRFWKDQFNCFATSVELSWMANSSLSFSFIWYTDPNKSTESQPKKPRVYKYTNSQI